MEIPTEVYQIDTELHLQLCTRSSKKPVLQFGIAW